MKPPHKIGSTIQLHFKLFLHDNSLLDATPFDQPATLTLGDGTLPDAFERCICEMQLGEKKSHFIKSEAAFGTHNPKQVQKLPFGTFKSLTLSKGLVVQFQDSSGADMLGIITHLSDDEVTVDFNHPLAGRDLIFEVELLSITPSPLISVSH